MNYVAWSAYAKNKLTFDIKFSVKTTTSDIQDIYTIFLGGSEIFYFTEWDLST